MNLAHRVFAAILSIIFLSTVIVPAAAAQSISQDDQNSIYGDTVWYKPGVGFNICSIGAIDGSTSAPNVSQIQVAKIIIGIAKTDNLGQKGALIGLMVGLDESSLTILGNTKIPLSLTYPNIQGVGSNGYSVGVFQQQPQYGWSTIATGDAALLNQAAIWQLMDPAYASEAFFGSPPGSNAPSALSKGLQNISGWQSMQPWVAAQAVQKSGTADGSNYQRFVSQAQSLLNQYWDSSPAIPLPVPVSGGSSGGSTGDQNSGSVCSNTPVSGSAQEIAQQILSNGNINLSCYSSTALQDVQAAAAGRVGTAGVMTSSAILQLIATVGQNHKVCVTAIQSGGQGHCGGIPKSGCPNDAHYNGDAVDFGNLDGVALRGRDSGSIVIMEIAFTILPRGSGFGQSQCGSGPSLPAGFIEFRDSCDHLHVQVPLGTP